MMNQELNVLPSPEVWAGVECTVNRVGDRYFDQLERNGHAARIDDLDRFAELGIRTIRYPILWERIAPDGLAQADWQWADERLNRLQELSICPIAGLLHHGSGPHYTSLINPAFPEQLAEFAAAVSNRYPWISHYTPVNEPLTTARFSGLYGHWYPHGQDDATFIRSLLNQCKGTVLAMQAIRRVNPAALLVQTEDMGVTLSTPLLAYQAELENHRRWLSIDLLCGRVNATHPLWSYLLASGATFAELEWFSENPCPPDILGINYYLTSDRFLDERLERYPAQFHGGNGQHQYADVEALRVCTEGIVGIGAILWKAWEQYQLPLAVTEVHLGSSREEQLRWLKEAWDAAQHLSREGVDIRAITVWSLLGAYDWNSLVTRENNFYEPGVFDLQAPLPRATALAAMVRKLSQGQTYSHPLLDLPGWWRRSKRLLYPPVQCDSDCYTAGYASRTAAIASAANAGKSSRPLLITGATGTLGQAFARICQRRGIPHCLLSRHEMDITDSASVYKVLLQFNPWAVINAAGYVRVDDAERDPYSCWAVNAEGAAVLAKACLKREIALVSFSSDLVFNGEQTLPYLESSEVSPLNVYGQSKVMAEQWVLATHPCSLVIRTSAFFGPWDVYNFLANALRTIESGQSFLAAEDMIISPTYVPDLVNATLDLLIDGECGLWHLANPGAINWADLARLVAQRAGLNAAKVEARPSETLGLIASRPSYSVLGSERASLLPPLEQAIERYLQERIA